MTRAHTAAVVARLRIDELANCVYDEVVPSKNGVVTVSKYLRVRSNTGDRDRAAERLTGPLGPIRKTFWLTGVGTTPGQAAWVLEQAGEVLRNWIPTVTGWRCRRLDGPISQPVGEDPEVDGRFFGVDQWDLYAEPAP